MGFYMLFMQRSAFKLGTKYWGAGALIIGIGLFFKALSPAESYFAIAVSPLFITIGLYLYLGGIWKFKKKKLNKWIVIGIPVFDIFQIFIFYNIFHLYRVQAVIHLSLIIIYCILAIFEMIRLKPDEKYLKKIFLVNALSFFFFMVLILLNVSAVIINPGFKPFEVTNSVIVMQIISGFLMIALTFGFLTAVNIRLNRELEDQIKSNNKFLSIIAHDLRGPVGNITNFLDLLQNETALSEKERKEYLKIINSLSQSTFHLLQNLLEWATKSKNLNKFKNDRIDLCQLISENIDYFKNSAVLKSIQIRFDSEEQTYLSGNANMLQTIVRNLVSNAVKYTPERGSITIISEKRQDKVRLIVSDTGQGIKPDIIKSLFKFETNESTAGTNGERGSGLGLVLCKELAYRMNGTIDVESNVGIGTTVTVEFPSYK